MKIEIPINLNYETKEAVPIPEIIGSLLSSEIFLTEAAKNLPALFQGMDIQKVQVKVQTLETGSLREAFILVLWFTFQEDLNEMPPYIEDLLGVNIPDKLEPIIVFLTVIIVFYGIGFAKDMLSQTVQDTPIRQQLNTMIDALAENTGKSPDQIRDFLDKKYKPKSKVKQLASNAVKWVRPSKSQENAPIQFGKVRIEPPTIKDVPDEYVYEQSAKTEAAKPYYGVELEIHQKDIDRENSGWAAKPIGLHDKRLPMKLLDAVEAEQLWGHDRIIGDIMLLSKRSGLEFIPSEIHLTKVTN